MEPQAPSAHASYQPNPIAQGTSARNPASRDSDGTDDPPCEDAAKYEGKSAFAESKAAPRLAKLT